MATGTFPEANLAPFLKWHKILIFLPQILLFVYVPADIILKSSKSK
jgi:hypothetical protein